MEAEHVLHGLHNLIQRVECVFVTCVCGILWMLSIYIYRCCMCISNRYVCNPVDAEYALPSHPGVACVFLTGILCDPVDVEYALPSHPGVAYMYF